VYGLGIFLLWPVRIILAEWSLSLLLLWDGPLACVLHGYGLALACVCLSLWSGLVFSIDLALRIDCILDMARCLCGLAYRLDGSACNNMCLRFIFYLSPSTCVVGAIGEFCSEPVVLWKFNPSSCRCPARGWSLGERTYGWVERCDCPASRIRTNNIVEL